MINLVGFVEFIDDYNRVSCLFPDVRTGSDNGNTRAQLQALSQKKNGKSPLHKNSFICKPNGAKKPLIIGAEGVTITNLKSLVGHMVKIECEPLDYKFENSIGWYLRIFSIRIIPNGSL